MIRKRFWMILGSFSLMVLMAFSVLGGSAEAQAQKAGQKITWVFATNPGPAANTWSFYPYPRFQKLLEKNSGGRLVLDTKMGLFPVNEVVHAVIAGRADIGWERIPWVAGTFPQWDYALPFFWDSIFEYEAFLNDPRMIEIERKSYGEKGLVKIADIPSEALDGIWGKKAVATVEDFKGYKVRTSGLITTLCHEAPGRLALDDSDRGNHGSPAEGHGGCDPDLARLGSGVRTRGCLHQCELLEIPVGVRRHAGGEQGQV